MNTLTQLMQYFGYASAFAFVAPAIVLCSIARLGLAKGAPNIVPDIITHGLLLIALGAGLFFQVTLARLTGSAHPIWLYVHGASLIISAVLSVVHLVMYRRLSQLR